MRLDKMSLLRGFYVSVHSTKANSKNLPCNLFKIDVHFKKQRLRKTVPMTFLKSVFIFSTNFKGNEQLIFEISQKVKT